MLENLHWATLEQHAQTKLVTLYKIVNNILHIPTHNKPCHHIRYEAIIPITFMYLQLEYKI